MGSAQTSGAIDLIAARCRYMEPGRHYHTPDHVASLLRLLDAHGGDATDRDAIELAIWDAPARDNLSWELGRLG
jgi:predicted metal-dependent HD superfamily phosphohydrolase